MEKPIFSIIIPVYKVEKYINKCIDAIINQTEKNIEIIIVDDGSPDKCPDICNEYALKDDRIIAIHQENGGLSDARNKGINEASGQYIMFVDSDDYIDLDSCERLLPYTKDNVDIIATDGIAEGGKVNLKHLGVRNDIVFTGTDYLKQTIVNGSNPMAAWLYVYRRDFLLENNLRFKKGILHEDEQFTPRAILKANRVVNTGITYYHYNIRENSIMTRPDKRKNVRDFYSTCMELSDIYDEIEDYELRDSLKDTLVKKYLSMFQEGCLYQYGKAYIHKGFVLKNAYKLRTKKKAWLFALSPKLYWCVNNHWKNRSRR